jgi:hypothetical protein
MLIKFSATVAAAALTGAAFVTLMPTAAYAAPCDKANATVNCGAQGVITLPGSGGGGGGGGSDGGGISLGPGNGCGNLPNGTPLAGCNPGAAAPAPLPQVPTTDIATDARARLQPPPLNIHTSPANRTYVQLRTGLWIDPGGLDSPPAAVANAPGNTAQQTVTATATAQRANVVWNMVENGNKVICQGPGSPTSTECGYTYKRSSASQPAGTYRISVSITWDIAWTCQGSCTQTDGTLPALTTVAFLDLPVDEIQNVSQPG